MAQPLPLDPVSETTPYESRVEVRPGLSLAVRQWVPAAPGGHAFLLVHGLASNARTWDGVAPVLAALGWAVVAVDQRGHGRSDKPDSGYDFEHVTDDLVGLIDAVGLERPIVVGQSWGGNVVLELAARHPDRIRGVACIDGGTIELAGTFPTWEDCAARLAPPRLAGLPLTAIEAHIRSAHPDWPETGVEGTLANFEVRPDGTVAPWLTYDRHMAILRALWEQRPSRLFPLIEVPVLLVPADTGEPEWTARKRVEVERAEASLRRPRVRWFAPADHDIQSQHPDELAGVLDEAARDGFFV